MSIIHEALKKSNPSDEISGGQTGLRRRRSGNWGPLFILFLCFLAAGPVLVPLLFKSPIATRSEGSSVAAQFAIEEAPLPAALPVRTAAPRSYKPGTFVLSGVVYSPEDAYCLINGMVLRSGDTVGNATVRQIMPDRVTLDVGGRLMELLVTPV